MPFCGFNLQMVKGLTTFADGLFSATVERAKEKGIGLEQAFTEEVNELGQFLEALENEYQTAKRRSGGNGVRAAKKTSKWVARKDKPVMRKSRSRAGRETT